MAIDTRADRAQYLREFLLSQAMDKAIDDELLQDALTIIKLPIGQLNISQFKLDQLLDEFKAGNIGNEAFLLAWRRVKQEGQRETKSVKQEKPVIQSVEHKPWMPFVVVLALGLAAILGWVGYQFWQVRQFYQEEVLASKNSVNADNPVRAYVAEGINLASMAKVSVAEYFMSMGKYPNSNEQIGLAAPSELRSNAVSAVAVGEDGVITITYNHVVGENQTIILKPTATAAGSLVWDCKEGTVPAHYRPVLCR